jgi:tetratricopeptide (TPR) repeat protein/SAM-dependent methyltransferase
MLLWSGPVIRGSLRVNRKQRRILAKRGNLTPAAHGAGVGPSARIAELLAAAQRYHQSGQLTEADGYYRKILAIDPNHVDSLHLLGVIAHQVGRNDMAVQLIRKAIGLNNRIPIFHNNIALALDALGRTQNAVAHFRRAIALQPTYAEAHNNLGATLQAQKKFDEAVAQYQRALDIKPDFVEAHNNLGSALKEQGKLGQAEVRLQRALMLKPNSAEAHHNLGNVLKRQGKLDEAVVRYQRALTLRPDFAEAHYDLGNALCEQDRLDEAVSHFQQALSCKQHYPDAHNNLGNALWKLGRLDAAVREYQQALTCRSDFAEAHNNLGNVLLDQAKVDQAVVHYRRALALNPNQAEAYNNLGNALGQQGQLDAAIALYKRALVLKPDFSEAHNNLGAALQHQGNLAQAIVQYRSALALNPAYADAHSNLGKAFMEGGDATEALKAIQRSIEIEEAENTKLLFVECVRTLDCIPHGMDLRDALTRALSEPWGRPGDVARLAGNLLKLNGATSACIKRATAAWPKRLPKQELFKPSEFTEVCDNRLLRSLLGSTTIRDIELERFLTATRFTMLEAASGGIHTHGSEDNAPSFFCALAHQCFINEYMFACTDHEIEQAQRLQTLLIEALASGTSIPELWLIAAAAYSPLTSLPLAELLPNRLWSAPVAALVACQVQERHEEQRLQTSVPRLTPIGDNISLLVKQQYEENPYPRWIKAAPVGRSVTIDGYLRRKFPLIFLPVSRKDDLEILVAGCGTGQHSIETARRFVGARVLAVDLSLSSLCYAKRKTHELGLNNIEYAQADILQINSIARAFDVIEASGVLHHLAEPMAGWRLLLSMLRPGGFMRLGLYSKLARRDIVNARRFIAEHGYGSSSEDIRQCRQELIGFDDDRSLSKVTELADFFSTSGCRDLLFHVQEHHLNLPEISLFLRQNGLKLLGFELPGRVLRDFRHRFPNDKTMTDLDLWHTFEIENPSIFAGMYQFWIQKIS